MEVGASETTLSIAFLSYVYICRITSTAVSIAATSVPSAALFLMAMTLSVIGAPLSDVSLLFTTEWLLYVFNFRSNLKGERFHMFEIKC